DLEHALFGPQNASHAHSSDFDTISHESGLRRAVGGTLFLRQLHDMPTRHQVRLARVLRDGEAWVRIAYETPALTAVHTRVIGSIESTGSAAPDTRVSHDLRKRFPHSPIQLPALRDRREDIPGLIRSLLQDLCEAIDAPAKTASRQAIALLSA